MLPPHSSLSPLLSSAWHYLYPDSAFSTSTHTHTLNVCVSWRGKLAKRLPAVCLPTSLCCLPPSLPWLLLLLLAPPFIEPRWQLVDFLCGNSHAKTKPISPFICGRQLRRCRSAFLFSALSLSPPFSFSFSPFSLCLFCVLVFFCQLFLFTFLRGTRLPPTRQRNQ